jgi:hypothetical protein
MISFVVYFHSSRTYNLNQTLRFLKAREKCQKEIVLICNDFTIDKFPDCRLINMELSDYRKPLMCNEGVKRSEGEIIALLDSDRIMPEGYFCWVAENIKKGEFVSCEKSMKLTRDYTDEEISSGKLEFYEDVRSKGWDLWQKNLFAGNTVFYKSDYLATGGMDESFFGYGFSDNDMSRNVISKGYQAKWTPQTEIHLHHEAQVLASGMVVGSNSYMKQSWKNMCKFLKKWNDREEYLRRCGCEII